MRTQKQSRAQMVEAIMLFDHKGVAVEMLYPEFEAILDNMVQMPKFADQQVRAAYVLISPRLLVSRLVLFYLDFDEHGVVESSWNLELRHLGEKAASGPDLGGGPIRLACRSQSPIPWYEMHLWDADLSPSNNELHMIRDAVHNNNLGLAVDDDTKPIIELQRLQVAQEDKWQQQEQMHELLRQTVEREKEQRHKAAQLIRQQRLRISSMESAHTESLAKLRQQAEQEKEQALKQQARLEQIVERLQEKQIQLEQELADKHEQVQQAIFGQERLQRSVEELASQAGERILQRLDEAGVKLVAVHPGAGHISIALAEVEGYLAKPQAFAAKKCLVSEEHYAQWLQHYENPACDALLQDDSICCLPLERKSHPSQFTSGISNRCSRHRQLT